MNNNFPFEEKNIPKKKLTWNSKIFKGVKFVIRWILFVLWTCVAIFFIVFYPLMLLTGCIFGGEDKAISDVYKLISKIK